MSAALFLARAGRSTIVYDAGRSRIFAVERVREFVGFDGWTPEQMLTKAREEVLRYSAQIRSGIVTKIESRSDGLFDVFAPDVTITARSIVLATGLIDELPPLKGLRKVWGAISVYAHALAEMKSGTSASLCSACRNAWHT